MNEKENFIEISISQLKEVLKTFIKINKPVLIHSKPGIGKSTVIKDIAMENGWQFVDIRPSQMPAEEIGGIPVPEKDEKTNLYRMIKALPSIYPIDENSEGILFLDELTTCREDVQNALLQLCQERTLTGVTCNGKVWKLPNKWVIISACNDLDSNQYGIELSQPLNNRFAHIFLSSEPQMLLKDFLVYANNKKFNNLVIDFINSCGAKYLYENDLLQEGYTVYATPRSWEAVSEILNSFGEEKLKEEIKKEYNLKILLRSLLSKECYISFIYYITMTLKKNTSSTCKSISNEIEAVINELKNKATLEPIEKIEGFNKIFELIDNEVLNSNLTYNDEENIKCKLNETQQALTIDNFGTFLISFLYFIYYANMREENKHKILKLLSYNETNSAIKRSGIYGAEFLETMIYKNYEKFFFRKPLLKNTDVAQ